MTRKKNEFRTIVPIIILKHNKYTQSIMENEISTTLRVIPLHIGIFIIGVIFNRCENRIDVMIYFIIL